MTAQTVPCPQCQGALILERNRRYVQCTFCGSRFVLTAGPSESPQLTRFETTESGISIEQVEQRLAAVEQEITETEEEAQQSHSDVASATSAYWRGRLGLQRVIAPSQNATYLAGLLTLAAGFLALFAFRGSDRLVAAVIALLLALVAWGLHREWRDEEKLGEGDLLEATMAIEEAESSHRTVQAHLEDLNLERSLFRERIQALQGGAGS